MCVPVRGMWNAEYGKWRANELFKILHSSSALSVTTDLSMLREDLFQPLNHNLLIIRPEAVEILRRGLFELVGGVEKCVDSARGFDGFFDVGEFGVAVELRA